MGSRRGAIRAVISARQHTTTAASKEGARWPVGCARHHTGCAMQRPPHPHQPRHWWMLNCPRICRPMLSVERNCRTRCWLQKPSAISARRRRPWLVSTCLALLGGSTRINGYFPSVGKSRGKNLDFDFSISSKKLRFSILNSGIVHH